MSTAKLSPSELWSKMIETPRPVKTVTFPRMIEGESVDVAIRVLTQDEQARLVLDAQTDTRRALEKKKLPFDLTDDGVRQLLEFNNTVELLFHVCRDPNDPTQSFFRSRDEIRKHLTSDECAILANEWMLFTSEVSPLIGEMSDSEMEALIEYIAGAGASLPLARMTPRALLRLLNFMACRLYSLRQDTESHGSQLPEPANG